ncbi:MATE family efflux transporter [Asticcacaulis machinosus]|uniref:Multidrug-efflux transporter n=1 Tax=Asticcacaulis machinosus TaxID=2984211 RepID=A0ABT5HE67_9CAUL|nr:MATE family efflux transporter [Asticcacaulis machinosus]MDC7674551.1 MATE family efflux transporter [Asticcacaulis machinosus]
MKPFLPTPSFQSYKAAFTELYTLAWPVVISRLSIMLMGLADTVIVGHYSSKELGYHSMAWAPTSIFLVTSIGLLVGLQVKTSHYLGAGETGRIGAVFQRGMSYALALGLGSMILLLLAGPYLLDHTVTQSLAEGARNPLILFAISMPFYMVSIGCSEFLEALGKTRQTMYMNMAGNVLNVALLILLVPGQVAGLEAFDGAMGAAVSTFIARIFIMVLMLIYVFRLPQAREYGILRKHAPDPAAAKEQRHVGYAAGASYFIEVTAFAGMTFFAGRISEVAVAQWAIVLNFASLVFMVPMGLAVGCSVLVGRAFGARDRDAIRRMGRVSFTAAGAFMVLVVVGVLLFSGAMARGYTSDPALIAGVQACLLLACGFFIPDGVQVVAAQALRARRDVVTPTVLHYISYGAVMLPLGYLFSQAMGLGVPGLIYAVIIASLLSGSFLVGRFMWLDHRQVALPKI